MKLPKIRNLTEEQKKVYLYAPSDAHILIHGPPGTGKTLIACLRAIELQKKKIPVTLGMFNRVLTRYSSNVGEGNEMPSKTVVSWFRAWWAESGLPPHPATSGRIPINVPFAEKDEAKAAGATWNPAGWRPWGRGKGVWMVDFETYASNPGRFQRWPLWPSPPVVEGDSNRIDWDAVSRHMLDHEEKIPDKALELGTLIVDEGQDFPENFYRFLRQLAVLTTAPGRTVAYPLRCFVLADENQQITEENSTLRQIASALRIDKGHQYLLLDNFRNSREIAELARSFFADVSALPRLPKRTSSKPIYAHVAHLSDVVNRIRIWLNNNPLKEVGVLVFKDGTRNSIVELLRTSVAGMRGRKIVVQTYSWNSRTENRVDDLLFDKPDVVTVLNMQSCKGLEFDAVFIVDPHDAQIGLYGPDRFKMQMFVAVSRGRDWVNLVDSGRQAGQGPYFECLPGEDVLEREVSGEVHPPPDEKSHRNAPAAVAVQVSRHRDKGEAHAAANNGNWEDDFMNLARARRLKFIDYRAKNGSLWVEGGHELAGILEPIGFHYSEKRAAWWIK